MIDQNPEPVPVVTPSVELWPYERFAPLTPSIRRRTFERMSRAGSFPPLVRLTPRSEPLWSADQVRRWLADKYASVALPKANEGGCA
jgi:hypothetical protein